MCSLALLIIENFLDLYIGSFLLCFLGNTKFGKRVVHSKIIIKSNDKRVIMHRRTVRENMVKYTSDWNISDIAPEQRAACKR